MSAPKPFAPDAAKVWTMPPGAAFLKELAAALADAVDLKKDPAALADALIYVPNRRSARALAAALFDAAGERAILMPDIRPLGDLENDEPPPGADLALADLGPPVSEAERLGALARMVSLFYEKRGDRLPPNSALAAAQELARLLDQAALAGLEDWSALESLADDSDLASHWAQSVEFLKIVTEHWPAWLDAQGALEPFARRLQTAKAVTAHWRERAPTGLVIIAGSTGATPASRILMAAAAGLDKGRVILPGLDPDDALSGVDAPGHPQFALAKALYALQVKRADVPVWPLRTDPPHADARRALIRQALAPAAKTADWLSRLEEMAGERRPEDFARDAIDGLSLVEAKDEAEEALAAALLMRETLETPGRRGALVTPDPNLARRASAVLKRWGVDCPPSAGIPLLQTEAGRLPALVLRWALDPGDPVKMCALLKHSMSGFSSGDVDVFERSALRGPRTWRSLGDLAERDGAGTIPARLSAALHAAAPGMATGGPIDGRQAGEELAALVSELGGDAAWTGAAGEASAGLLQDLAAIAGELGAIEADDLAGLLDSLASGRSVPPETGEHSQIAIWGPLEARLQDADHIILAGLNEGIWPTQPPADAFLPRRFRKDLGLEAPEARLGLSAHDFAQLASAPRVTLLLSKRREDAPAVASRWVWRIKTLARGAGVERDLEPRPADDPRAWAAALRETDDPGIDAEPKPRPPADARPRRLSVTRIGQLQRDPYAIYAESVLGLKKLDPLNAPVGPRERGTAIHAAIEDFERAGGGDADVLAAAIEAELIAAGQLEEEAIAARAITRRTADWFLSWRADRAGDVARLFLEVGGKTIIDVAGEAFTLSAKADRIDQLADGRLAIVDFKTGAPPSDKEIGAGLDQQMPLQALIAQRGGFDGVAAGEAAELIYIAFKARPAVRVVLAKSDPSDLAADAEAGLVKLLDRYFDPQTPFLSAPRPQFVKYAGDYDRLARRAEWASDTSDE